MTPGCADCDGYRYLDHFFHDVGCPRCTCNLDRCRTTRPSSSPEENQ